MAKKKHIPKTKQSNIDDDPATEAKRKGYYFDNHKVEQLLIKYVADCCVDVRLRDEIMGHAAELIRQIIRTHNFHNIYPGSDDASFNDLFQVAWCQIESTLYKFDWSPGHTKVFNMWCVSPETLLLTSGGIMPISEIEHNAVEAFGIDGPHPVQAYIRKPEQNTLRVFTALNYNIECTPLHVLLANRGGELEWVRAEQLKVGDLLAIQYDQNYFANRDSLSDIALGSIARHKWPLPEVINEEMAYILGLFIAEGSIDRNTIFIYNSEKEIIDKLQNNSIGLKFGYYKRNSAAYVCNKRFREFINKVGFSDVLSSKTKCIPQRLMRCSRSVIIPLLSGIFDGDGHSSRHNGQVGFSSTSLLLTNQVRALLNNLGILSKLQIDNRIGHTSKTIRRHQSVDITRRSVGYQLNLSSYDSRKFYETIGFKVCRKQDKSVNLPQERRMIFGLVEHIRNLYKKYGAKSIGYDALRPIIRNKSGACTLSTIKEKLPAWSEHANDDDFVKAMLRIGEQTLPGPKLAWLPIRRIEPSCSVVCEISVDSDDHTYSGNNIIVSNSQVAKTVMLAHIKRETRDKKNYKSYKRHLDTKTIRKSIYMKRFLSEAKEICKYNKEYSCILEAIGKLYDIDNKPHEGLIGKIVKVSGLSRQKVSSFLRQMRLRSFEFTDAPACEESEKKDGRVKRTHKTFDEDEYD